MTALNEIMIIEQREESLLNWMVDLKVTNREEQNNCENMLIAARRVYKEADAKRKELQDPARQEIDEIKNQFQPFLDRLTTGINACDSALRKYHAEEQARIHAEQLRIAIEQAQNVQDAQVTGEVVTLPVAAPQDVPKTSHANIGTVTYKKVLKVQIVNADLVPRQYCEPVMSKLNAAAKSGVKEIAGCIISEETETMARGSR
jgi:hypothetical protein